MTCLRAFLPRILFLSLLSLSTSAHAGDVGGNVRAGAGVVRVTSGGGQRSLAAGVVEAGARYKDTIFSLHSFMPLAHLGEGATEIGATLGYRITLLKIVYLTPQIGLALTKPTATSARALTIPAAVQTDVGFGSHLSAGLRPVVSVGKNTKLAGLLVTVGYSF